MRIPLVFSSVLVQHVVFTVYYLNRVMAEVNVILRIFFLILKCFFQRIFSFIG